AAGGGGEGEKLDRGGGVPAHSRLLERRAVKRSISQTCCRFALAAAALLALTGQELRVARASEAPVVIGERPAIEAHVDQAQIEAGRISFKELFHRGQLLFDARFNNLDGQGRPAMTGDGRPRGANHPAFIRPPGPDSNSCFGCHNQPRSGGGGDFVANVFVLAQERDPVVTTLDPRDSNERNTLGMFGSGAIELLAREMTAELIAIREAALAEAKQRGAIVRRDLKAKGISFGVVAAYPDGRVDPRGIDGVDWDLIIKPFHQKG